MEEKSKETNEISGYTDGDEAKNDKETDENKNKTSEYFKAVTQNAVYDLEHAIKTEETLRDRLEAAEDR